MDNQISCEDFFNFSEIFQKELFTTKSPFDLVGGGLKDFIGKLLTELGVENEPIIHGNVDKGAVIEGRVYIAKGAKVGPTAFICGPTFIGPDAEVRHGAYIRGNVYVGERAVVGHATEVKGSIFLDDAKAGHFAYVGDSILGRNVNLGAGTKLANLKLKGDEVSVKCPKTDQLVKTGHRKLGAIIGDNAQTGCNAVLSPGTLLLPKTLVMPCVHYHGTLKKGLAK